jgi:hypothetical protein
MKEYGIGVLVTPYHDQAKWNAFEEQYKKSYAGEWLEYPKYVY